jgi:hypothetical protein
VITEEFFIMDAHENGVFPNKDFFPDINNLFGDMSLSDDNTNGGSASTLAPTPYVFLIFAFVLQFLGLAIDLDMLDMFCSYRSLVNMVSLISMFLAILCLLFSWIKYHGKLLSFPTIQKPYAFHRQFSPIGYAASLKSPVFEGVNYKRWRARTVIWLTTRAANESSSSGLDLAQLGSN